MYSIRGAITVDNNKSEEIIKETENLLNEMLKANEIDIEDIVAVLFTATKDLTTAYPAEAARNIGIKYASLLCFQEMFVENSLEKCIRVLMLVNGNKKQNEVKHIFLKKAKNLRPDLMKEF
ncbi:chorismate mutase [Thermobrachium celere]|uniref:chorismate mutase n=1 Tax=Thermobrachium celere DSM 8682 TaxID=941824 RepID=R7RS04_9CLOT|nr:chorismate mutase [Thermobrachium celere]GFR34312.1 chorismate mutase AroH [Thermobrachium celere]CDF58166.1 Chorismate mutase II [Thermobrachium celere DSM 8682]